MSRIEDILVRVRDTLADRNKERWSDDRLLRLIDEAQLDICMRAKLLRDNVSLVVIDNVADYKLPNDLIQIDRVTLNGERLPLIGFSALDEEQGANWEKERGKPTHCVFDKQMQGFIKLYPIPNLNDGNNYHFVPAFAKDFSNGFNSDFGELGKGTHGDSVTSDFGVINAMTELMQVTIDNTPAVKLIPYEIFNPFGITGSIFCDGISVEKDNTVGIVTGFDNLAQTSDFGLLNYIAGDNKEYEIKGDFGIVSDIIVNTGILNIRYIKKPKPVTSIYSNIEISEMFDKAIKYYVTSKAFGDDMDTQNRAVGQEEFNMYLRELDIAQELDTKDFTRNSAKHWEIRYNDGF